MHRRSSLRFTLPLGLEVCLLLLSGMPGIGAAQTGPASEYGAHPEIPAPDSSFLPTLNIAKQVGWPDGGKPRAARGLTVTALARDLDHPRSLYVLPNGDVLAAETNAPPDEDSGIMDVVERVVLYFAGASQAPSADRITLLRPGPDGELAERHVFLRGLHSPFGMAVIGHAFYVADTNALLRFPYSDGDTEIHGAGATVTALPSSRLIGHWTRGLLASPDGSKLYVGIGSTSNVGENGLEAEAERAAIWEIDVATGRHRVYASGLRNPVGLAWEPQSGALWASVNERDGMGDHLPPDYMTAVRVGGFYGWPYSYFGQHVDGRVKAQDPGLVAKAIAPDYALGAHTASLGLCWSGAADLPSPFHRGMFIGQHGSWNRSVPGGYQVVFVAFDGGQPRGLPIDVLTGFLNARGQAQGRPVGLAIDRQGALLVADDVGNTVWRVTAAPGIAAVDLKPAGSDD
jgi:glucose/arabinose dehydrogenase